MYIIRVRLVCTYTVNLIRHIHAMLLQLEDAGRRWSSSVLQSVDNKFYYNTDERSSASPVDRTMDRHSNLTRDRSNDRTVDRFDYDHRRSSDHTRGRSNERREDSTIHRSKDRKRDRSGDRRERSNDHLGDRYSRNGSNDRVIDNYNDRTRDRDGSNDRMVDYNNMRGRYGSNDRLIAEENLYNRERRGSSGVYSGAYSRDRSNRRTVDREGSQPSAFRRPPRILDLPPAVAAVMRQVGAILFSRFIADA